MIPEEFPPFIYVVSNISLLFWREFAIAFQADELFRKGDKLPGFASFTVEIFHRLYYEPEPEKREPSPPESAWAEKLHDEFAEIAGFENLIQQCEGNHLAAGVATREFCEEILNRLPLPHYSLQDPQKLRDFIKRLHNSSQSPAYLLQQTPTFNDRERLDLIKEIHDAGDDVAELTESLRQAGRKAVQDAQQYGESLDDSAIRQTIRAALVQTEQKLEDAAEWLAMIGLGWGTEEAAEHYVSQKERMHLLQRIAMNEKLRSIAKLVGRLKEVCDRKRRTKTDDTFGELSTIELGNNLARLLPSELQKLAEPTLFPLFAKGYYEHSLLQYKIEGKEKKAKGPLIVCLDSSGSMRGLPDTWAKAVTSVLGQIAYKDNRHFRIIHFDIRVRRTDDFPPKHHGFSSLLESMLSFYNGGGTNWEPALAEALGYIEENKSFIKADIVLITDGICKLSKDFLKKLVFQKQQRHINVFSILIGSHSEKSLTKFTDRIWQIRNLNAEADTQIEELFTI